MFDGTDGNFVEQSIGDGNALIVNFKGFTGLGPNVLVSPWNEYFKPR
jgi:hypothetical protein